MSLGRVVRTATGALNPGFWCCLIRSHEDRYRLTRADPRTKVLRRLGMIRRLWRTDPEYVREHRAELDRIEALCGLPRPYRAARR